jgi:hypothetical protein
VASAAVRFWIAFGINFVSGFLVFSPSMCWC